MSIAGADTASRAVAIAETLQVASTPQYIAIQHTRSPHRDSDSETEYTAA